MYTMKLSHSTAFNLTLLHRQLARYRCVFVFVISILFFSFQAKAQQSDVTVEANIIYHFTKYINWPEDKKSGDFIIGIIGNATLFDALKNSIVNKTAGTQKIVIKKYTTEATTFNCQILFIGDDESGSVKKIAAATIGTPVLLVTETDGMARKGSCINFTIVDDHLKLEINKNNIEKRKLDIASELLQLGIAVK
jgi:hypothetical protein